MVDVERCRGFYELENMTEGSCESEHVFFFSKRKVSFHFDAIHCLSAGSKRTHYQPYTASCSLKVAQNEVVCMRIHHLFFKFGLKFSQKMRNVTQSPADLAQKVMPFMRTPRVSLF